LGGEGLLQLEPPIGKTTAPTANDPNSKSQRRRSISR
jgi:hypothetical protein